MRPIDADAAKNEFYALMKELTKATIVPLSENALSALAGYNIIENAPTIDVVPMVRCENCRHMSGRTNFVVWGVDCFCGFGHHSTGPDFYCADGELKHDTDDQ